MEVNTKHRKVKWLIEAIFLGALLGVGSADLYFTPGSFQRLECEIPDDEPVSWTLNGQAFISSNEPSLDPKFSLGPYGVLFANDLQDEDEGIYECYPDNAPVPTATIIMRPVGAGPSFGKKKRKKKKKKRKKKKRGARSGDGFGDYDDGYGDIGNDPYSGGAGYYKPRPPVRFHNNAIGARDIDDDDDYRGNPILKASSGGAGYYKPRLPLRYHNNYGSGGPDDYDEDDEFRGNPILKASSGGAGYYKSRPPLRYQNNLYGPSGAIDDNYSDYDDDDDYSPNRRSSKRRYLSGYNKKRQSGLYKDNSKPSDNPRFNVILQASKAGAEYNPQADPHRYMNNG